MSNKHIVIRTIIDNLMRIVFNRVDYDLVEYGADVKTSQLGKLKNMINNQGNEPHGESYEDLFELR